MKMKMKPKWEANTWKKKIYTEREFLRKLGASFGEAEFDRNEAARHVDFNIPVASNNGCVVA